jgi:hypothetical protein
MLVQIIPVWMYVPGQEDEDYLLKIIMTNPPSAEYITTTDPYLLVRMRGWEEA